MIVTVVDREAMDASWGRGPFQVILATVETSDRCPVCGGPRGKPEQRSFHEDGVNYAADCWTNPCGHVDAYADVICDGRRLRTESW